MQYLAWMGGYKDGGRMGAGGRSVEQQVWHQGTAGGMHGGPRGFAGLPCWPGPQAVQ